MSPWFKGDRAQRDGVGLSLVPGDHAQREGGLLSPVCASLKLCNSFPWAATH